MGNALEETRLGCGAVLPPLAGDAAVASAESKHLAVQPDLDGNPLVMPPFPKPWRRPLSALAWVARFLFGLLSLVLLLTVAAATPVLNLLALGYLLEAAGGVARSGTLRRSLPLAAAARTGAIVVGTAVVLLPVWLLGRAAADAYWITGASWATARWYAGLAVAAGISGLHLAGVWASGGSLGSFFRPIRNARLLWRGLRRGDSWEQADRSLRDFLAAWRLPQHFWLGLRGFVGCWAWLIVPTLLYLPPPQGLAAWRGVVTLAAGAALAVVLAWLPFFQVRLAAENRWSAMFDVRGMRKAARRAPLAWLLATTLLYASSIPLLLYTAHWRMHVPYPVDITWDLALTSIVCTLPARLVLGWAYHRATLRRPAWWGLVWLSRLLLACVLLLYVWLLYHVPMAHQSAHPWLLEHHGLVLPAPWDG